jgi:hypothetical protein
MIYKQIVEVANAPYVQGVMYNTWGHLAPKIGVTYKGWILFGTNAFGTMNPQLLDAEFEEPNNDLMPSSPWSHEHIEDYLFKRFDLHYRNKKTKHFKPGCVYKFHGTYTIYKNGSHSFNGKFTKINTNN